MSLLLSRREPNPQPWCILFFTLKGWLQGHGPLPNPGSRSTDSHLCVKLRELLMMYQRMSVSVYVNDVLEDMGVRMRGAPANQASFLSETRARGSAPKSSGHLPGRIKWDKNPSPYTLYQGCTFSSLIWRRRVVTCSTGPNSLAARSLPRKRGEKGRLRGGILGAALAA